MLKTFFASVFAIIFNIFFLLSFILFVLLNTILNVDFYKGPVSERFYETAVDVASGAIYKQRDQMKLDFTEAELKNVLMEVVSEKDFEDTLVPFVQQLVEPKFDENGVAVVMLDLSNIVGKLPDFAGVLAEKLFDTLPDCEKGAEPTDANLCIPADLKIEDFKQQAVTALDAGFLSSIPSKVKIFEFHEQNLKVYKDMKLDKDLLWNVWWMTIAINVLLLVIIALIILKPWHRVVRWISKPLISGSIFVSLFFLSLYYLPTILSRIIKSDASVSKEVLEQMDPILCFIGDFFGLISTKALIFAGSVLVVGLSLYIFGLYGKRRSNDK